MWPKIVQVNKTDVFIIGGNNTTVTTQFDQDQKTLPVTLMIDLNTGML